MKPLLLLLASFPISVLCGQQRPDDLSAADWTSIQEVHAANARAVFAVDGRHEARNDGQQWRLRFDGRGVSVRPDEGDWSWGLELVSYGFADEAHGVAAPRSVQAEGAILTYGWDDRLDEWYVNGATGLEHGYTVRARPDGDGALTFLLRVRGDLAPAIRNGGRDVAFARAGGTMLHYDGLHVSDADGRALPAHFDVVPSGLLLSIDERGARYPLVIDPVAQQAYLKASNSGIFDRFGTAVAVSGDTVVVGAYGESSNATGVGGNQADNSATTAGAAYVFVRSGGTWSQQAYLKASNTDASDSFGVAVAIDGDTLVVGALGESSNAAGVGGNQANNSLSKAGAAYVFVRSGTVWTQQAYLKASNPGQLEAFGSAVAISGETVVVSAPYENSASTGVNGSQLDDGFYGAGAAYVFVRSGAAWSQQAYLKPSNTEGDNFGQSVAVSDDTIVVGAPAEASGATGVNGNQADNSAQAAGAVYVFVRGGGAWSQQAYLKASNTEAFDRFGWSVAVAGDTAAVGAIGESSGATGINGNQADNGASLAGAAYVFARTGGSWLQQAYVKSSNAGASDQFGWSLAVSGDAMVVGAMSESSHAVGVDGDQTDNSSLSAGAAYVFARSGGAWSQQAYLKASNTDANDLFGIAVAVAGDTVVVGAQREASGATGVDGNQADNGTALAGAAYTFHLRSGCVGSNGRPWLQPANAPQIGQPYALDVGNLNPTYNLAVLVFGFTQLPLPGIDLGPILAMPGCDGYQTADVLMAVPSGAGGTAQWNWLVTGAPGDTFHCQALCLDPSANAFGFTLSNAISITLQP